MGFVVACAGLEVLVRVFAPQPKSWLEVYRELPDPLCFGLIPDAQATVDTGDSRWSIRTDRDGRRVESSETVHAPDTGAAEQVPVIGDSFVFGYGVEFRQTFVALLNSNSVGRRRFRDEGVPGYGPIQYRFLLERDLAGAQAPRGVIVVSYLGNDFFDCIWDKHPILNNGTLGDTGGLRSFLKRHVHLYRLVSRLWHTVGVRAKENSLPMFTSADWAAEPLLRAKTIFEREFLAMREACAVRGVPLLVVLIPPVETVRHAAENSSAAQYDLPLRAARDVLEALHVNFVDTTSGLVKHGFNKSFLRVDGHLSARGNEVVRDSILQALDSDSNWK